MAMTVLQYSDEIQVNTIIAGSQSGPDVTQLPDGGWLVTWTSDNGSNSSDIFMQRYDAAGRPFWPADMAVNALAAGEQILPKVTVLADGGWVITWRSGTSPDLDIYQQRYDKDGNPQFLDGSNKPLEKLVSALSTGNQEDPEITALADGGWLVTWLSNNGAASGIFQQRYDKDGIPLFVDGSNNATDDRVNIASAGFEGYPVVTVLEDGGWIVAWHAGSASDRNVYMQRYNAEGVRQFSADVRVNATTASDQWFPSVTGLADGGWLVTWQSLNQDGSGHGVYMQRYDKDGKALFVDEATGEPIDVRVADNINGNQGYPSVTALDNGGWVITWEATYDVHQRIFNADGSTSGPDIIVPAWLGSDLNSKPSVTTLTDGRWVVTWQTLNQDASPGTGISQRVFSTSGEVLTTGRDWALGSDANDILQISAGTLSAGDRLEGGGGTDTLLMIEAGQLDLRNAAGIVDFEILRGSAGDDIIVTDGTWTDRIATIDGGDGDDILRLEGGLIYDLTVTTLSGFESIVVAPQAHSRVIVGDVATALMVQAAGSQDTIVLASGMFSEADLLQLAANGIEFAIDDAGTHTIRRTLNALDGDVVSVNDGNSVRLDLNGNAVINSQVAQDTMVVQIANRVAGEDRLGVVEGNGIVLSKGIAIGSVVSVDGIEIGTISQDGSGNSGLAVDFFPEATSELIQKLIRSLTYINGKDADATTGPRNILVTLKDSAGGVDTATVTVVVMAENDSPILKLPDDNPSGLDTSLLTPFASVEVLDVDSTYLVVTITPDDVAKGTFLNLGAGQIDPATGAYVISGTALQVKTALKFLQFDPRDRADMPTGSVETTRFTITVSDGESADKSAILVLEVIAANHAPSSVRLDGKTTLAISENTQVGDFIGELSATDPDGDLIERYELAEPNDFFEIVQEGDVWKVKLKAGVDYETVAQRQHVLRITASDGTNTSAVQEITINVTNDPSDDPVGPVGDAPGVAVEPGGAVSEAIDNGSPVAPFTGLYFSGPDTGEITVRISFAATHGILEGLGNLIPEVANGIKTYTFRGTAAVLNTLIDFVTFKPTDNPTGVAGSKVTTDFTIAVTDAAHPDPVLGTVTVETTIANRTPTGISLSNQSVLEMAANDTVVGILSAVDPNAGETFVYELSDDRFTIVDNELRVKDGSRLDFETGATHQISVRVIDQGGSGLAYTETFTIIIRDVVEVLPGTKGKDNLKGGIGSDRFSGGFGNDTLNGGGGSDVFVFDSKLGTAKTDRNVNFDTIKDFSVRDDSIWLDNAIFKKLGSGSTSKPKQLNSKFFSLDKAKDKNDYIIYNKKTGILSYDADGSGSKAAIEFAKLAKNLKLTYKEFFVV